MDDSDQLALLSQRQVTVLEDFTFAEGNPHEGLLIVGEEKVVAHVLKLQVGRAAGRDQLVDRL